MTSCSDLQLGFKPPLSSSHNCPSSGFAFSFSLSSFRQMSVFFFKVALWEFLEINKQTGEGNPLWAWRLWVRAVFGVGHGEPYTFARWPCRMKLRVSWEHCFLAGTPDRSSSQERPDAAMFMKTVHAHWNAWVIVIIRTWSLLNSWVVKVPFGTPRETQAPSKLWLTAAASL